MTTIVKVIATHGWPVLVTPLSRKGALVEQPTRVAPGETREFCVHSGQDLSVHEIQPGEELIVEGSVTAEKMSGLPVAGYRPQSMDAIARANALKQMEERVLRLLDELKADPEIDQRWLATGRTDIEKGFSCAVRSIFKPGRVELPE